jgi:diguanylate cyclase (GGDEF)-like protein
MTPTDLSNLASAHDGDQQTALTCYQSAILAIAKCMAEVCPRVGLVYNHRLMRLPRRLGFDATPEALAASREAVEADVAEYGQAASAWVNAGVELAHEILAAAGKAGEGDGHTDELHAAMMEELAEQMEISAEVDDATQVRTALKRYATGLRSYVQRRKKEKPPALTELRHRAEALAEWLGSANPSNIIDSLTGLLNRQEGERQLQAYLKRDKPFCVLLFEWTEARSVPPQFGRSGADQILKALGDRLITLVRPRDVVYRWNQDQLAVIFECAGEEAMARSVKIADWLSSKYSAVVDGIVWKVEAQAAVAVIERHANEPIQDFIQRIDAALKPEVAQPVA